MKLYIPEIGDSIKLTKDWTFKLYYEHRNSSLIDNNVRLFADKYGLSNTSAILSYKDLARELCSTTRDKEIFVDCVLSKDTLLTIDRIYIRKGLGEFSSISFYIENGSRSRKRFWAKLDDVNNIECDKAVDAIPQKITWTYVKNKLPNISTSVIIPAISKRPVDLVGATFDSVEALIACNPSYVIVNHEWGIDVYKPMLEYTSKSPFAYAHDMYPWISYVYDGTKITQGFSSTADGEPFFLAQQSKHKSTCMLKVRQIIGYVK